QYLTAEYAKNTLASTNSVLETTLETGLSSPSRLHDLFVTVEAMSPGEYKAAGAGLEIRYGIHSTPFGKAWIATTERGICNLQFLEGAGVEDGGDSAVEHHLRKTWPNARLIEDAAGTEVVCDRIFSSRLSSPTSPLTVLVKGTNFQIQVWRALLNIPFGHLTTYQTIATAIGRPTAVRAIGSAIGSNAVAYLIPCHRIIRASGDLSGYRWGCDRKAAILGWEASQLAVRKEQEEKARNGVV
ncbi:MAG TPA: methylated-DNA--[protein]-cysteine S-methyltransferase, partial [Trichocoleus sp.]